MSSGDGGKIFPAAAADDSVAPRDRAKLTTVASAADCILCPLPWLLSWHRTGGQYRPASVFRRINFVLSIAQAPVTGQVPGEEYGTSESAK